MGFFRVFAIGCLLLACHCEAQYASGTCNPCQQQQMQPQQPVGCSTCGQSNYQYDQSSQVGYGAANNGQYGQAQTQYSGNPYQQQDYPQQQMQGGYGTQYQGSSNGYGNTNQYNPQQQQPQYGQQSSQYGYQNNQQSQYGQQSGYQNGQTQQYQQMGTNSYAQGQGQQQGQQGSTGSSNSSEPGYLPDYRGDQYTDPQRIKDTQALNAPFFQSIGGEPVYPGGVPPKNGSGNTGTGGTGTNSNNNYAQQYSGRRK